MNEKLQLLWALTALETDYWYEVDHRYGRSAHTMYVEDGVFAIGEQRMEGHGAIRAFYRWREERGARTARHLVSNMRLARAGPGTASFECIMVLYAADGTPVLESRPAVMLADIVSDCVLASDGSWRYTSHELRPVFMGGQATLPPEQLARRKESTP